MSESAAYGIEHIRASLISLEAHVLKFNKEESKTKQTQLLISVITRDESSLPIVQRILALGQSLF